MLARSLRSLVRPAQSLHTSRSAVVATTTTRNHIRHTYATMASTTTTTSSSSSYTIPETYGNFKRSAGPVNLQESYNQPINVTKWTSDKTGLRVVHVDVEGPLCNLYASVATEIFNDSGCPHTLEQSVPCPRLCSWRRLTPMTGTYIPFDSDSLVFLGSEKYPFKVRAGTLRECGGRAGALTLLSARPV